MSAYRNKRWVQIVMAVLPVASLSLLTFFPFVWRALKTKKASDIRLAVIFTALEVVMLTALSLSERTYKAGPDNVIAMFMWFVMLAATITAAYIYRPLNKEEQAAQAQDTRSGSTFL